MLNFLVQGVLKNLKKPYDIDYCYSRVRIATNSAWSGLFVNKSKVHKEKIWRSWLAHINVSGGWFVNALLEYYLTVHEDVFLRQDEA